MEIKVHWRYLLGSCDACDTDIKEYLENDEKWQAFIKKIALEAKIKGKPLIDAMTCFAVEKCNSKGWHRNQVYQVCVMPDVLSVVVYVTPRRKVTHVFASIVDAQRWWSEEKLAKCKAVHAAYKDSSSTVWAVKGFNLAKKGDYWDRKKDAAAMALYSHEAKRLHFLYDKRAKAKHLASKQRELQRYKAKCSPHVNLQERFCLRLLEKADYMSGHIEPPKYSDSNDDLIRQAAAWRFPVASGVCQNSYVINCMEPVFSSPVRNLVSSVIRSNKWPSKRVELISCLRRFSASLVASKSFVHLLLPLSSCEIVRFVRDNETWKPCIWQDSQGEEWIKIPVLFRPSAIFQYGACYMSEDIATWKYATRPERFLMKAYYGKIAEGKDFYVLEHDLGNGALVMSDGINRRWLEMKLNGTYRKMSVEIGCHSPLDKMEPGSVRESLKELAAIIGKVVSVKSVSKTRRLTLEE